MTTPLEDRLRTELREEANGQQPGADFAVSTVGHVLARRRRRQIRVVAAIGALVVVIAAGGVALGAQRDDATAPADDRHDTDLPMPPELDPADIQRSPRPGVWESLPWRESALPRVLPEDVAAAPALSEDPVDRALALVAGPGATVGVVGDDGRLRRLDGVALEKSLNADGYRYNPLEEGALTSDGTRAAFPQVGAVATVDLATGDSQSYDVPGLNTGVLWHPDQRHVLVGRSGPHRSPTRLLDTVDGSVEDVPYDSYVTAIAPDGTVLEVRAGTPYWRRGEILRWRDGESERVPLSISVYTSTAPSATDRYVVVAGATSYAETDGWVVLDTETGQPVSMLLADLGEYWPFDLHGWLGDDTVLIQTDDGIAAWTPSTGALERVTEVSSTISLARAAID